VKENGSAFPKQTGCPAMDVKGRRGPSVFNNPEVTFSSTIFGFVCPWELLQLLRPRAGWLFSCSLERSCFCLLPSPFHPCSCCVGFRRASRGPGHASASPPALNPTPRKPPWEFFSRGRCRARLGAQPGSGGRGAPSSGPAEHRGRPGEGGCSRPARGKLGAGSGVPSDRERTASPGGALTVGGNGREGSVGSPPGGGCRLSPHAAVSPSPPPPRSPPCIRGPRPLDAPLMLPVIPPGSASPAPLLGAVAKAVARRPLPGARAPPPAPARCSPSPT